MYRSTILAAAAGLLLTAAAPADDRADALAVIDKAVKAAGGEEKLSALRAVTWKRTLTLADGTKVAEVGALQLPDRYRLDATVERDGNKVRRTVVLSDDKGWVKQDDRTEEMPAETIAELQEGLHVLRLTLSLVALRDKEITLAPLKETTVNERPASGVKASRQGRRDAQLFFDKESGLLLRADSKVRDAATGKEVPQEVTYADHKEFDGVRVATRSEARRDGKLFGKSELVEFKVVTKLDDGLFDKP